MSKLALVILTTVLLSNSVFAQQVECEQRLKPHYYDGTGTVRTHGLAELRTFPIISREFKDRDTCDKALEFKRAQTGIAPKGFIMKHQYVSYEADCLPVEFCSVE